MKKIIIYRDSLLPKSETFIKQQALSLREWDPTLMGRKLVADGLSVSELKYKLLPYARRYPWRLLPMLRRSVQRRMDTAELSKVQSELIHIHFGTDAVDNWQAISKLGLPTIITLHGYDININRDWWESGNGGIHRRNYPERLIQLANDPMVILIAVSKAIKERAISQGLPSNKIRVRYIGVDTTIFSQGSTPLTGRSKRILFVGRLVEKKGVAHLIRAFSRVRAKIQDAELAIVGDGPLRQSLQSLAESMNVPVEFFGAANQQQVLQFMHESRIFCLPSVVAANGDAEGLPIVILEACSAGLGVVTSARGATNEVIRHEETGLCLDERDEDALTACLLRFLNEPDFLESCAIRARLHVQHNFDLKRCSSELEMLYSEHEQSVRKPASASRH